MRSALSAFRFFNPILRCVMRRGSLFSPPYSILWVLNCVWLKALSLFWPLNGVMAGVFARYAYLNRLHNYAVAYVAMLMYDAVTTSWGMASLVINLSNMIFIVVVAILVLRDKRLMKTPDPLNALRLFTTA